MFVCVTCEDIGENERARRAKRDEIAMCETRLNRSALPRDYALMMRTREHLSERQRSILDSVTGDRDVYLHGKAGAGKTSVACVLLSEAVRKGARGMYAVVPDLMADLRMIYARSRPGDGQSSSTLVDPLIDADVLVLDDIGKEKPSEHAATVLFEIFDGRYRRRTTGRWTAVVSNYPPAAIGARFADAESADPLVRRMTDGAKVIEVLA